jgi:Putative carbohydrate metabolism domain
MKIAITVLFAALCMPLGLQAQTPANGNLEDWQQSQSGLYEQPTGGFWTSLNPLRDLGAPVTVEKVTDACQGQYAAKLTTQSFSTLLVAGLLASGSFNPGNLLNPLTIGRPFTQKPANFKGCYKYSPVGGDSCAIISIITRWNTQTNQRDTIAEAGGIFANAIDSYTNFDFPYEYYTQDTPDSIQLVLTSSADGANSNGQVGSAMWVDNISLDLLNGLSLPMMPEAEVKCYPNPAMGNVVFDIAAITGQSTLMLYGADGKLAATQLVMPGINTIQLVTLPVGTYTYTIAQNNQALYWGTLVHN